MEFKTSIIRKHRDEKKGESRPSFLVLLLLALFPLVLLEILPIPVIDTFEWTVFDAKMRLRNEVWPQPISDKIVVVGVSEADEERLGTDLSSRQSYIELLNLMRSWEARTVTFDIFFRDEKPADSLFAFALSENDPATILGYHFKYRPPAFRPTGKPPEDIAPFIEVATNSTDSVELREAVYQFDDYLQQLLQYRDSTELTEQEDLDIRRTLAWAREIRGNLLRRWFLLNHGAEKPVPAGGSPYEGRDLTLLSPHLMLSSTSLGFANVEKDEHDVVRYAPLVYEYEGRFFPHLSLATALAWYGVDFDDVEINWGSELRFQPTRNATYEIRIPIDFRGRYLVNYREGESFLNRNPTIGAVVLPDFRESYFGENAAEQFHDRFIILGEVISGGIATDLEPIPLQTRFPMVGMHANILDNIINRDFLTPASTALQISIICLAALLMALLYYYLSFSSATWITGLSLVCYTIAQFILFNAPGIVLDVVKPVAGSLLAVSLFFGYLIVIKDRDRRLVRDVFLRSVSPRIGEEILKNYNDEAIWGAQRTITVLFIDIRGYTALTEQRKPEEVLGILDRFYDIASQCVFRNEGQVNKFLGDAVLALFGALPEEPADHQTRAIRAAAEIQSAMRELSRLEEMEKGGLTLGTGAGLNTGEATVGLVGRSRIRIEYTALGDAVNTASRLQNLAGAGEILIGEEVIAGLDGPPEEVLEQLGLRLLSEERLTVKGKAEPVKSYRAAVMESLRPSAEEVALLKKKRNR